MSVVDRDLRRRTNTVGGPSVVEREPSTNLRFFRHHLGPDITLTRASTATYFDANGVLQTAAAGEPRFTHDPATGKALGLLVEGQRTNFALDSFNPATQTVSLSSTGDYTLSVTGSGSCAVAANTATGTGFGTATEGSPVTFNISATGTVDLTVTGSLDRFQLEDGTFPTSPIETAGTTVTRADDDASMGLPSELADGFVWVIHARTAPGRETTINRMTVIHDGSVDNRVLIDWHTNDALRVFINKNGSSFFNEDVATIPADTDFKIAIRALGGNYAISIDGGAPTTSSDSDFPEGLSEKVIGGPISTSSSVDRWNSTIAYDAMYPNPGDWSDADLQEASS